MKARLLVVAAAVVPRLVVLLRERDAILANFTEKSDSFASTFVHHGTFGFVPGEPSAYTQPLYGWFLVPVYWIFGRHWLAVGLAQIALAALTALLVYEIGRRLLSPRAGLLAALAATLSPYLVWHDVHVNREIVDQICAAALVLAALLARERPTPLRFAAVGAISGIAILGNTRLFALPLVLVAYLAWGVGPRRAAALGALMLACAGLALLPWLVRNRVQLGCWALTTDARALWKANDRFTHGVLARGGWLDDVPRTQPPGRPLTPEEAQFLYERGRKVHVDECAQVPYYEHRVFTFWRDHPGEKARLAAQAARMLWNPRVTETSGRSGAGTSLDVGRRWVAPLYTGVLFVLGAIGLFLAPRALAVLAVLLLGYQTAAALAFAGATRYRVSWDFLVALLAAAAVERALARRRAR